MGASSSHNLNRSRDEFPVLLKELHDRDTRHAIIVVPNVFPPKPSSTISTKTGGERMSNSLLCEYYSTTVTTVVTSHLTSLTDD